MAVAGVAWILLVIVLTALGSASLGLIILVVSGCLIPLEAGIEAVKAVARHRWAPFTGVLAAILYLPGWALAAGGGAVIALAGADADWSTGLGGFGRFVTAVAAWLVGHWGLAPHPAPLRLAELWAEANVLMLALAGSLWLLLLVANALEGVLWAAAGRPVPETESLSVNWAQHAKDMAAAQLQPIPSDSWLAENLDKARAFFRENPREARWWLKRHAGHSLVRQLGDVFGTE